MKHLKKLTAFLLIGAMLLVLGACQREEGPKETTPPPEYEPFVEEDPGIQYYTYGEDLSDVAVTEEGYYRLWQDESYTPYALEEDAVPSISAYLVESETATGCLIISPGGGYVMCNSAASELVAQQISEKFGISVFVLHYRAKPNNYKAILSDQLRAIRFVRYFADDFNVDPNYVGVLGFSAGGHLALMAGEHYDYGKKNGDNIDALSSRPDVVALGYPAASMMGEEADSVSCQNFLNGENTEENRIRFSGEMAIRPDMPPVFVVHSKNDTVVPIQSSYLLVKALEENGLSCTYHWYEKGGHGYGMGDEQTGTADWTDKLQRWLTEQNFPMVNS